MRNHLIAALCVLWGFGTPSISAPWPATEEGYRIPTADPGLQFPRDHGSHPEFRIEWWYITGHLREVEAPQRRHGFQATWFRVALQPPHEASSTNQSFASNHLHLAHVAWTDVVGKSHHHEERINREGWDAWAKVGDLDLRNGNWTLKRTSGENMRMRTSVRDRARFDLALAPTQPKVLFGEGGREKKGAPDSAASWYITFPRLKCTGTLTVDGSDRAVEGEAWMDHEISSSQLGADQVGWDWASVRLNDGRSMMVYILRQKEGTPSPYSTMAWITPDGKVTQFGPDRFTWKPLRSWTSPKTGTTYPIEVELSGPQLGSDESFRWQLRPLMDEQEMVGELGGIDYWEGACEVLENGRVIGEAFIELTGYGEPLDAVR